MKTEVMDICKALGDSNRLRIMMCLDGSFLCLCQLTEILELAPSTVSQHVELLVRCGLLDEHREGKWHYYKWTGETAGNCAREFQALLRKYCSGDLQMEEDKARRAVVMTKAEIPCPKIALSRVLFLCTGNSCRSQMAEALLRAESGGRFDVYSAGLDPRPIHEMTYEVMKEIGIDISMQKPTDIKSYLGKVYFGYLIAVCGNAENRCPVFPGVSTRLYWPVKDPAEVKGARGVKLQAFRSARDELRQKIIDWLNGMKKKEEKTS